ncbi:MAG: alpha/beta hydrolase family protein [Candidatus Obscuribacterales bacterium]
MQTAVPEKQAVSKILAPTRKRRALSVLAFGALVACALSVLLLPYWHIAGDKLHVSLGWQPKFSGAKLSNSGATDADPQSWRTQLRAELYKLLGVTPELSQLNYKILRDETVETMNSEGTQLRYRRQQFEISSRTHKEIAGFLLIPPCPSSGPAAAKNGKRPCVICVPGHGQGLDHVVGINSDGLLFKLWDGSPRDYALFFAKRGYIVCAFEQIGIGQRCEMENDRRFEKFECLLTDARLRYTGKNTLGERVEDARRVVSFVAAQPEIDPTRIVMMGLSAGGTTTLYTAALDQRVKCAIVASAFAAPRESIFKKAQCLCNYVPGVHTTATPSAVAALIAPRFLLVETGLQDPFYPAQSAQQEFTDCQAMFKASGVGDNVTIDVQNHGHRQFYGLGALRFLAQWL